MANDINDIVGKAGLKSVDDLKLKVEQAHLAIQDTIVGINSMNTALAKSTNMSQFTKAQNDYAKSQELTRKAVASAQLQEEKLAAFRANEAAKEQARAAKRLADEQRALAQDEKRIATLQRKANAQFSGGSPVSLVEQSSGSVVSGADANSAAAISGGTQAIQSKTKARKLSNNELLKEIELEKQASIQQRNFIKESVAVKGSLEQRQLALARLQKTQSQLSQQELASPFGKRLSTTIGQLNEQVLTLEKNQGKAGRNVGNYVSGFDKIAGGATKAFGALRFLANVIPGLGIGGLIGILAEPLVQAISNLDLFKEKISTTAKTLAASSGEYKKAVSDISALGVSVKEFNDGTIGKKELVDRYNESLGGTIGNLKTAAEVEDFYNKKSEAFIQATFLRAQANAALELSTTKATEALQRQIDGPSIGDYAKGILNAFRKGNITGGSDLIYGTAKSRADGINDLKKGSNELVKLYQNLKVEADKYAKVNGLNFNPDNNKGKKGVDPAIQARKNATALIQVQIDANKELADIYQKQVDNENFSQETRLEALNNFNETQFEIARLEQDKEVAQKKLSDEEKLKVDADYHKKANEINRNASEKTLQIDKQAADELTRIRAFQNQKELTLIEKQRDEELIAVNLAYAQGVITLETFEKRKLEIQKKYALIETAEQIRQAEFQLSLLEATGADTTDAEAKLTALKLKRLQIVTDATKDANEKQLLSEKEKVEKLIELGQALFDFSRSLTSSLFEANIANLEEEKDIRQKATDTQIENVNESILSEEDKAERVKVINAQNEQAQLAIDARIAAQKRKAAIADKAFALGQIVINTAVAVSKVAAQTGIFALAGIGPIIALGALQAAAVLAQPIPKFKDGGTMKKSGLAQFGEVGRELRINPDGSTELTPDKTTVGFVQAGTKFITAAETKRLMAKPNGINSEGKSWDISGMVNAINKGAKDTQKAVKSIKIPTTIVTERGFERVGAKQIQFRGYISKTFGRN